MTFFLMNIDMQDNKGVASPSETERSPVPTDFSTPTISLTCRKETKTWEFETVQLVIRELL